MFLVDAILACLPMINAHKVHGLWGAIIVYMVVLANLRATDRWAVRNGWRWGRAGLKLLIWAAAIVLVSII